MKLTTVFWQWWYRHHPKPSKYTKETALSIAKEHELDAEVLALKAVEKSAMDAAKQLKDYLNTQEEIKAGE